VEVEDKVAPHKVHFTFESGKVKEVKVEAAKSAETP
jgi:hypothetical protein